MRAEALDDAALVAHNRDRACWRVAVWPALWRISRKRMGWPRVNEWLARRVRLELARVVAAPRAEALAARGREAAVRVRLGATEKIEAAQVSIRGSDAMPEQRAHANRARVALRRCWRRTRSCTCACARTCAHSYLERSGEIVASRLDYALPRGVFSEAARRACKWVPQKAVLEWLANGQRRRSTCRSRVGGEQHGRFQASKQPAALRSLRPRRRLGRRNRPSV